MRGEHARESGVRFGKEKRRTKHAIALRALGIKKENKIVWEKESRAFCFGGSAPDPPQGALPP